MREKKTTVALGAILVITGSALARPENSLFDLGSLVVSQVGDGTAALGSTGTLAALREFKIGTGFTTDDAVMPTSLVGSNRRLVVSGSATSEGFVTASTDGLHMCFQGYDAALATAAIAGTTAAATNRVFGRVDLSLNIDTSTAFNDAYSTGNIRSSVLNGSTVYTGGTGAATFGGVRSGPFGLAGASTAETTNLNNTRVVNIFGGNVYTSASSGSFVGISTVAGGSATLLFSTASGTGTASPYDFVFTNATTCYVADDRTIANGGGLQRWSNSGAGWVLDYTLTTGLTAGLRGLTFDPASGTLYATSADTLSKLVSVQDAGAGSSFNILATAATNTAFRGVEFVAVPAPGTLALLGLGGLVARRQRR